MFWNHHLDPLSMIYLRLCTTSDINAVTSSPVAGRDRPPCPRQQKFGSHHLLFQEPPAISHQPLIWIEIFSKAIVYQPAPWKALTSWPHQIGLPLCQEKIFLGPRSSDVCYHLTNSTWWSKHWGLNEKPSRISTPARRCKEQKWN